ncbi:MAG: hypothetical protein V3T88_01225 [Nitrosomonadaceae bacterium]
MPIIPEPDDSDQNSDGDTDSECCEEKEDILLEGIVLPELDMKTLNI